MWNTLYRFTLYFQADSNLDEIEMLSSLPQSQPPPAIPIPSFVLIPTTINGTDHSTNGNHSESGGQDGKPEMNHPENDRSSNDEESILYRSMTIAENQTHY